MNTLPKLFLFSGFLGSGKTTLLNLTARYLTEKGYKIAMVINEAGETGVDNLYMKKKGYMVKELFGGCICCTLAQNLKEMVLDLSEHYSLEAILMEPSGTASPKALYKPLCQAGYTGDSIHHISILDRSIPWSCRRTAHRSRESPCGLGGCPYPGSRPPRPFRQARWPALPSCLRRISP